MHEMPFDGFDEAIQKPLAEVDPESLERIKRLFLTASREVMEAPFAYLLGKLCGKHLDNTAARRHWENILPHKRDVEAKLGRRVSVQTAVVDYFFAIGNSDYLTFVDQSYRDLEPVRSPKGSQEWIDKIFSPSYFVDRLRDELQRATRYNHAVSSILLDIDHFHEINEQFSFKVGDEVLALVAHIVRKAVRTVDIVARFCGDRFLIILPNTNKREAEELAGRIRQMVAERTTKLKSIRKTITVTLAVSQAESEETAKLFTKRLESALDRGKVLQRDLVHTC